MPVIFSCPCLYGNHAGYVYCTTYLSAQTAGKKSFNRKLGLRLARNLNYRYKRGNLIFELYKQVIFCDIFSQRGAKGTILPSSFTDKDNQNGQRYLPARRRRKKCQKPASKEWVSAQCHLPGNPHFGQPGRSDNKA